MAGGTESALAPVLLVCLSSTITADRQCTSSECVRKWHLHGHTQTVTHTDTHGHVYTYTHAHTAYTHTHTHLALPSQCTWMCSDAYPSSQSIQSHNWRSFLAQWTHPLFLCVHAYRWPDIHRMKVKDRNLVIETATEEIFFRLVCGYSGGLAQFGSCVVCTRATESINGLH